MCVKCKSVVDANKSECMTGVLAGVTEFARFCIDNALWKVHYER